MNPWPKEKAWQWYAAVPWLCGFNYLPRTAVNFTDMWQRETFDLATIEEELGWARAAGFNAVRSNLPFIVWQADRDGLFERFGQFLQVATANQLRIVPCPLDDCGFSGDDPYLGPQKPPVPGVHNSQAAASPGRNVVVDKDKWGEIEEYVKDVVSTFATDARILIWDLYNEPGNRMIFRPDAAGMFPEVLEQRSYELMERVFAWARELDPPQPLTVGGWMVPPPWHASEDTHNHFIDRRAFELSDVLTFHAYCQPARLERVIAKLKRYDRPMLCTEWMARPIGSRIDNQLPIFQREKIGCFQWGLVKGKTQTNVPWPAVKERMMDDGANTEWFHDLLEPDGSPYSPEEIRLIQELVRAPETGDRAS